MKKSRPSKTKHKRISPSFIGVIIAVSALAVLVITRVTAQNLFPQFSKQAGVDVSATVGSSSLTISGYQSPYASIILKTATGTFLASTTADAQGYFSFSNVLINGSQLSYCFQAVDFKRIGISESCITISGPITGDVEYTDVFLPPTIGLSRKQINAGQDAVIYGYSMPGASVYIAINGQIVTVTADSEGFYSYTYKDVPAGTFTISATASFNDTDSLSPTNDVTLEALSVPQQITETGEKVIEKVKEAVPFNFLPYILLALALLTAIGILLYKLKIGPWMILIDFLRRKKKMHHDWFLDKW